MQAITININAINTFKLKSIESVNDWLSGLGAKVHVISAERTTDGKRNLHYHVMADIDEVTKNYLWQLKIWNDEVTNELSYYEYIIKDGKYKVYDYQPPFRVQNQNQYAMMLDDMFVHDLTLDELRIKYPMLFVRHFNNILKIYQSRELK